jgi:hypothetical protein
MLSAAAKDRTAGLAELEADARYARERYQVYKAKAYGSRPTSPGRLRVLKQRSMFATRRLDRARADGEPRPRPGSAARPRP